jgi:hypothetical protein
MLVLILNLRGRFLFCNPVTLVIIRDLYAVSIAILPSSNLTIVIPVPNAILSLPARPIALEEAPFRGFTHHGLMLRNLPKK